MSNFEINFNDSSSSSDSLVDGYMSWSAKGTEDGSVPAKNFFVKSGSGDKVVVTAIKEKGDGVVMDIYNMKTGWQRFFPDGSVEWVYNDDLKDWKSRPSEEHKQGISVDCVINDKLVVWRQAGYAIIEGFKSMSASLKEAKDGKLPVVKLKDVKQEKFKVGSTQIPILEVTDWVDRPFVLEAQTEGTTSKSKEEF
jgi:DNA-directed RNA polymerase subunit K/omega